MFFFFFFPQPVIPKALLELPPVLPVVLFRLFPGRCSSRNIWAPPSLGEKLKPIFFSELKQNFSKGFLFFPLLG